MIEREKDGVMNPDLQRFIDRVVVPALLERFLQEHQPSAAPSPSVPLSPAEQHA